MPIHFNSPEHMKERQEVKPLTLEEMKFLVETLSEAIDIAEDAHHTNDYSEDRKLLQRMVYEYENHKHAYISSRNVTEDIEVIYTVESKNKSDDR